MKLKNKGTHHKFQCKLCDRNTPRAKSFTHAPVVPVVTNQDNNDNHDNQDNQCNQDNQDNQDNLDSHENHYNQENQVRLAHLWVDFRVICSGELLVQSIYRQMFLDCDHCST